MAGLVYCPDVACGDQQGWSSSTQKATNTQCSHLQLLSEGQPHLTQLPLVSAIWTDEFLSSSPSSNWCALEGSSMAFLEICLPNLFNYKKNTCCWVLCFTEVWRTCSSLLPQAESISNQNVLLMHFWSISLNLILFKKNLGHVLEDHALWCEA